MISNKLFEFVKKVARLEFPLNECTAVTHVDPDATWEGDFCATPAVRKNGNAVIIRRGSQIRAISLRTFETPGQTQVKAGFSPRLNELFIVA